MDIPVTGKKLAIGVGILVLAVAVFGHGRSRADQSRVDRAGASDGCVYRVTAEVLNVRASPSLHARVVRTLGNGDTLQPHARTVRHGGVRWRQLTDHEWVSDKFLTQDHCEG